MDMWILRNCKINPFFKKKRDLLLQAGFTLLEVMVAMSIIAIAMSAVLGSQSQGVSLATEAKFNTTASLLAQSKIVEIAFEGPENISNGSGDFGEDFAGYFWEVMVKDAFFYEPKGVSDHLKQVDLNVYWGEDKKYQCRLRRYLFFRKTG